MLHGVRQNRFPTPHAMVQSGAQTTDVCVHDRVKTDIRCLGAALTTDVCVHDRVKTVLAGLAQLRDPLGIQVSDAQGTVASGTLVDGDEMEDFFHPTCNLRLAVGFDMCGKPSPLDAGIVIEPAHAWIEQANHVLRAGWLGLSGILRPVQLAEMARPFRHSPPSTTRGPNPREAGSG